MTPLQQNTTRWVLPERRGPGAESAALCRELGCAPFIAQLLCARGITRADEARAFLFPRLKTLSDPFALPDMRAAVERILLAIDRKERIALYGDYDVDGVSSLALFTRVLRAFGADPKPFLPVRMDEGYGLSTDGVARCLKECAPQLLIAVDCGTCSREEIKTLRGKNVDVLVFDHHECKGELPECAALVNPKLGAAGEGEDGGSRIENGGERRIHPPSAILDPPDFTYLCSAGIVFKACHALLKKRPLAGFDLREYLDLAALGTVADIVPLVRENRIFVKHGMKQMETTRWPGLRALMDGAGVKSPLRTGDIGFKLGPRINAAGRLASAEQALELLLTEDTTRAAELAKNLNAQNRERQEVEHDILRQAEEMVRAEFDPARDAAIVLGGDGWHPGVLGIVASRLCKANHRPALVIGFDESGMGKGSGRSIEGFSLVKALTCCGGFLEKSGGHEMAAGLTLRRENFAEFQRAFRECARAQLTDEQLQPRLHLDAELELSSIDFELLKQHEALQPFGTANYQPLFLARCVTPGDVRVLKEKHLKFMLWQGCDSSRGYPAIFFGGAEKDLPPPPWDIAFQIDRNEYKGSISIQLDIKSVRATAG